MQHLNEIYKKTIDFILNNDNFLIISHDRPDGDTLGSALALYLFLRKLDKKVSLVCKSPVPKVFLFLKGVEQLQTDFLAGDYQSVVLIDNGDLKRTGFDRRIKEYRRQGKPIINIDHHPINDIWKIAKINLVDLEASSTAEIIYNLMIKLNASMIDADIATALLVGVYTDTGGFQHSTTKPQTLVLASNLMSNGGKLKLISKHLSGHHSYRILKLWGEVLKRLHISQKYHLVTSVITQNDIKEIGCSEEDLAGVVNLINSTNEASAVLLLYETKDGSIKGSLRTENDAIDVSKLAELLNGGGHKKAAGFSFKGRFIKVNNQYQVE